MTSNTRESGIQQPTPVGSYPGGVSPYGCYDMAGNVWEWMENLYEEPYRMARGERVVRGGSWLNVQEFVRCAFRYWVPPDARPYSTGVRFSRTP